MLRELHISNLAVIDDVRIDLSEGFNVFTGQTGAGKSLIIGAFEMLLGLRSMQAGQMLRAGAEEARVSGLFELRDAELVQQISKLLDIELAVNDQLLLTRKLFASGRSSVSVNGQPATAAMVRAVGELLVDIHGQHDHQYLLRPSNQLLILDAFAQCDAQRREYVSLHRQQQQLQARRDELTASRTLRQQQVDLYEFQAGEIDAADPVAGEYEAAQQRHNLLANARRLAEQVGQVHGALYDTEGAIVERLQAMVHVLGDLAEIDAELAELGEQTRTATLALQEVAFDLSRYLHRLEINPQELADVEDRLNTLNRLISKYGQNSPGDDSLAGVLDYRQQIEAELRDLRTQDEDLKTIDDQISAVRRQMAQVGQKLSRARHAAARKLAPRIDAELHELGMPDAQIHVAFTPVTDDQTPGSAAGLESAEFLIRTNPGQPARPLRKIASGGELSRIMLALKSVLAASDRISVLVFDEIDANIGGRLGTVIGTKLRGLAGCDGQAGHQVMCITHLPQIAAFADRHLRIAKSVQGKGSNRQTRTSVTVLAGPQRVEELAEMLAGKQVTATTRKQVGEMLELAGQS